MDKQLFNANSQDSGPVSVSSIGQPVEPPVMTQATPTVIPIEALLAITQALKQSITGSDLRLGRLASMVKET